MYSVAKTNMNTLCTMTKKIDGVFSDELDFLLYCILLHFVKHIPFMEQCIGHPRECHVIIFITCNYWK